jgi:hypothetical protein
MPSSRPNTIPTVIHLVRQLKPCSILDVGVGFGKWGHLFREYTDILEAEHDPTRYQRSNWKVRIDGIEGYAAYITGMHQYLYNQIHIGDARDLIKSLQRYDIIFAGDIIEHFEKPAGVRFLHDALTLANRAVIISTPKYETGQEDLCGNELERHRSLWTPKDFGAFPNAIIKTIDRATLLAVLPKKPMPNLVCGPPRQPSKLQLRRISDTQAALQRIARENAPFILVDEEQFRSELPPGRAIPFLEKDGQYWGSPPDDATAIRELERLRGSGARSIVFAWPAFWWLKFYSGFHVYLKDTYSLSQRSLNLVMFDLNPRRLENSGFRKAVRL